MVPCFLLPLLLGPWCNLDPHVHSDQDNSLHFPLRLHSALSPVLLFIDKVFWPYKPSHPQQLGTLAAVSAPLLECPHFSDKTPPSKVAQVLSHLPTTRKIGACESPHGSTGPYPNQVSCTGTRDVTLSSIHHFITHLNLSGHSTSTLGAVNHPVITKGPSTMGKIDT